MNQLDLALKKQRLQLRSDGLRGRWRAHLDELRPALVAGDRVHAGVQWLRRHPALPVAAGVALAVARPRLLWRWAQRGIVLWQVWRRGKHLLSR